MNLISRPLLGIVLCLILCSGSLYTNVSYSSDVSYFSDGASTARLTTPFTFTAIPDQDQRHLQLRFSKIALYLSDQLDIDVRYIPVKSYAAAVTAFRNNQVQLGWFGGLSGVQARLGKG